MFHTRKARSSKPSAPSDARQGNPPLGGFLFGRLTHVTCMHLTHAALPISSATKPDSWRRQGGLALVDTKRMIVHSSRPTDRRIVRRPIHFRHRREPSHAQSAYTRRPAGCLDRLHACPGRLRRRCRTSRASGCNPGRRGHPEARSRHPDPRTRRPGRSLAASRSAAAGGRYRRAPAVHRRRQRARRPAAVPAGPDRVPRRRQQRAGLGGTRPSHFGDGAAERQTFGRTGQDRRGQPPGQRQRAGRAAPGAGGSTRGPGRTAGRWASAGSPRRSAAASDVPA